jgi:D-alanine-D-alanine ligase
MKDFRKWKPEVHVLIPSALENGAYTSPLYDTPAFRAQLDSWFKSLNLRWTWESVTVENFEQVVAGIAAKSKRTPCLAFNLCDGDEITGYPGNSVVRALEKKKLPFTGADSVFYEISTYKLVMKECFTEANVPTAAYVRINTGDDVLRAGETIGYPFILKPDVSAGSYGIGLKSVVRDYDSAVAQSGQVTSGPHSEFFNKCGLFAESFIAGPEFTALVVADLRAAEGLRVYPVTERVFHSALPAEEKFLSYDRYWEFYEEESRLPEGEPFYRYQLADRKLQEPLSAIARKAFRSVQGKGYGRVDMRMDKASGQIYVLEVNANCGLSNDEDSSIGRILQICEQPIQVLIEEIIHDAFDRAFASTQTRRKKARMPRAGKSASTTRTRPSL